MRDDGSWHWNRFKLGSYLLYLLVVLYSAGFLARSGVGGVLGLAAIVVVLGTTVALFGFAKDHPTRVRWYRGSVDVDFGVVARGHRLRHFAHGEIVELTTVLGLFFSLVRIRTATSKHEWMVSREIALLFAQRIATKNATRAPSDSGLS